MRFKDKVCLVTGGGSGIGRATCLRFASEGGAVVVADRDPAKGAETVRLIEAAGGKAAFQPVDIGIEAQIKAAVDATIRDHGRVDVLVNDAAMMTFTPIVDLATEDWDRVLNVNLLLGESVLGAPLGRSFVGLAGVGGAIWPAVLVYLGVLALIAVVTTVSRRVLAVPRPDGTPAPTGVLRALSFLPYVTVVFAAFVPLAAAVYILTSTTWTVVERWILRRVLDPERRGAQPSTSH